MDELTVSPARGRGPARASLVLAADAPPRDRRSSSRPLGTPDALRTWAGRRGRRCGAGRRARAGRGARPDRGPAGDAAVRREHHQRSHSTGDRARRHDRAGLSRSCWRPSTARTSAVASCARGSSGCVRRASAGAGRRGLVVLLLVAFLALSAIWSAVFKPGRREAARTARSQRSRPRCCCSAPRSPAWWRRSARSSCSAATSSPPCAAGAGRGPPR